MFAHTCTKKRLRAVSVIGGVIAGVAVFLLTSGVFGIDIAVPSRPGGDEAELILPRVALVAVVGGLLALAASLAVERLAQGSRRTFVGVTMAGLALLLFIRTAGIAADSDARARQATLARE